VVRLLKPKDYLLGRKTFDIWEAYWPKHAAFWPGIQEGTKYVLSRRRKKSDWKNTVFIKSAADIKKLKRSNGPEIQVWGSSEVIHLLLKKDWVDELWLIIHPLTLGKGKKLFAGGEIPAAFKLIESNVTPSGVIIGHYRRAGRVTTGTIAAESLPKSSPKRYRYSHDEN
jgi:dihydrofolate reductase